MVPAKSDSLEGVIDVRFVPKGDIEARPFDVRFTPESRHGRPQRECPPGFAHLVRRGAGYQLIPEAWEQTL